MSNEIALELMAAMLEGIGGGLLVGGAYLLVCNVAVRLYRRYANSRGVVGIERVGGASAASASSFVGSSP